MLRVRDLARNGLQPCSFAVGKGECVAVRGASGAGKTLLMRALADLDPSQGEVYVDGVARSFMTGPEWRRKVGYVPAEPGWWSERIADHFPDPDKAVRLAQSLGVAAEVFGRLVSEASTGERLRLALVRALLTDPAALLLDEPTAALDQASTARVEALIAERLGNGLCVVWTTHDTGQAERMASRILTVEAGVISVERDDSLVNHTAQATIEVAAKQAEACDRRERI